MPSSFYCGGAPLGEVRYNSGVTPRDYTFTGQFSYIIPSTSGVTEGFGLMFYNARWLCSVPATKWRGYDPSLGRFAQADTIVPGGVQGLDRYAYVNNSPTRFTDPSGHRCVPEDECKGFSPIGNRMDPVRLSPQARDLIDLAKSIGKTPEQVIAVGIGHEIMGWVGKDRDLAKQHFYNNFADFARDFCNGTPSYNCM